jgi:hypothetical protein
MPVVVLLLSRTLKRSEFPFTAGSVEKQSVAVAESGALN